MTTLPRRVLRAGSLLLACLLLGPATASAGSPGEVNFAKPAESNFDAFTKAPTASQQAWMRDHYFRMRTYSPYFDTRLSWFPNAWSYADAYAIYRGAEAGLEQYILTDANGNRLYIPFACSGGTCTQYAADIGDPGWRARYINEAKAKVTKGYKGIFVDDVNLAFRVGDGNGNFVAPWDERTNAPMTLDNWQRYFAEFMEQLRAALPAEFEIVHNQVYFHAGLSNSYVRRAIEAADHIEIERGVIDTGIVGGTGTYGYETVLAWAEYAHSRGKGVVWDAQSTWGREYQLATYFLLSNGLDTLAHPEGSNPDNWWSGYDVDLGQPLGQRYSSNGVFRRDFQNGIVLVNQPGQTTKTLSLGSEHKNLAGSTVTSVTLPARAGAVLLHPGTAPAPAPEPTPEPAPAPGDGIEKSAGRPASSSTFEAAGLEAPNANDANPSTRWSSAYADNQWWQVDLGSVRAVDAVELNWEVAYAKTYKIQTSTDGATFTDVASVTLDAARMQRTTFAATAARYVRVLCLTRGTAWGFSIWDARVFGPADSTATPPPPPPPPPPPADTTAPDTSITSGPSATVTATTATFGLASTEPSSTFECRLDGAAWTPCSDPVTLSGLATGWHVFEARARDAAGNVDASPASQRWNVKRNKGMVRTAARSSADAATSRHVEVRGRAILTGRATRSKLTRVHIVLERHSSRGWKRVAAKRVRTRARGRFTTTFPRASGTRYRVRARGAGTRAVRLVLDRGMPRIATTRAAA